MPCRPFWGAGGPIADELVRELRAHYTADIRLVGRHPHRVADADELVAADLLDAQATVRAVAGSDTAYFTVGLPMDAAQWEARFPVMMRNAIDACERHGTRLEFFDNTYMYPGTPAPQVDGQVAFAPNGPKGRVRARLATMLQSEMDAGRIEALICRAPEFYGPGKTKSLTNRLVFDRIRAQRRPLVSVSADTKRSLIWTPDASRAMALLGNTPDAYGQTWHLPIDPDRRTYRELIGLAACAAGRAIGWTVLPRPVFTIGGRLVPALGEVRELLPRYAHDNIFDSAKFAARFPGFRVTGYREGIEELLAQPVR
ncbi:NAD-dependent epimerase/dehydratase family protein [Brevibacterium sp. BRM-1]|uniref:NAD-dependent epimerase/dehydratase family protein n=1 Tax=Brevibacterium sp. BRM-1 TaxID=2999062 RepID=UPI002280C4BC|nr:NAD-dependent epimerase/dehydratase family protein [Brevibacterium sp. BRM-1]WAL40062.1 NAD-dependent epimerase/dehydratase family protein [Brevibacterium sp. BRM-1]